MQADVDSVSYDASAVFGTRGEMFGRVRISSKDLQIISIAAIYNLTTVTKELVSKYFHLSIQVRLKHAILDRRLLVGLF